MHPPRHAAQAEASESGAQCEMNSISIEDNGNNNSGIIIAQRGLCLPLAVFARWQAGYALDMNSIWWEGKGWRLGKLSNEDGKAFDILCRRVSIPGPS